MKLNKFFLFACIYFFFNSVGLPMGLLYTSLFAPIFLVYLIYQGHKTLLINFFCLFLPFAVVHVINGVVIKDYMFSTLLLLTVYIFIYFFYVFGANNEKLGAVFKKLLILNFFLTLLAIVFFYSPYKNYFWYVNNVSKDLISFPRLSMFTYEASYYSTLLVPLVFYYFLNLFFGFHKKNQWQIILMIALPLLLSFSIGVLAAILISICIFFILHFSKVIVQKHFFYAFAFLFGGGVICILLLQHLYPENPLFTRLENIFEGHDTSAKGRTFDSFKLSMIIAKLKSIWWGVGQGQLKIIGHDTIMEYYKYPESYTNAVRIPNAFAETIATFGIFGAFLRIFFEVFFFFRTRVYANYYRLLLFIYIFIYQFTGSFITNVAEYVIWALAFSSCFPQFNKSAATNTLGNSI